MWRNLRRIEFRSCGESGSADRGQGRFTHFGGEAPGKGEQVNPRLVQFDVRGNNEPLSGRASLIDFVRRLPEVGAHQGNLEF